MDLIEMNKRLELLESEYKEKKSKVYVEYCKANNPYKIGDVFTDHMGSILIEKIKFAVWGSNPCCTFIGIELKKDGTPKKNGSKREAWQNNDVNR
jgi:hypothetical protein